MATKVDELIAIITFKLSVLFYGDPDGAFRPHQDLVRAWVDSELKDAIEEIVDGH